MTFANVYFRDFGLSGAEIGLVNTLSPLMGMLGGPSWGVLSDRLRNPRLVLMAAVFGGISSLLALSLATSLTGIALATAAYTLFASAFVPLLDSLNLGLLGENRARYGRQRMWGSIGFIVGSWLFGLILQQSGLHVLFYGVAAGLLLLLPGLAVLKIPQPPKQRAPWSGFVQFIRQPHWLVFTASLVLIGIVNTAMSNFLGVYIKDLKGGENLIGTAAALGVVTELPVMYFSSYLLKRFGSRGLMAIGFAFFAIRMALYALIPSPNWVLPIALLHGLTFTPFWVGSVSYASELAPENLKATAQGIFMSVVHLAAVVSSPVNGALYDWLGAAQFFLVNSALAVAALVVLGMGRKKQPRKIKQLV